MAPRKKNTLPAMDLQIGRYTTKGADAQDQLALWYQKVDKRKAGVSEQSFREMVSAILATRSWEGGFKLFKNDHDKDTVSCYDAVLKALMGELCVRYHGTDVYKVKEDCPKLQVVSTSEPNIRFSVQDRSMTVSWQAVEDVEPDLIGLVNGCKPMVINLPYFDQEVAYAWAPLNVPITVNNRDAVPVGLPVRYQELPELNADLMKLGGIVAKDLVERLQQWFIKRGYVVLLVKTDTGAQLVIPQTFEMNLTDWWSDNALYVFKQMGLPLFVPVMKADQALNQDLLNVGRNLDLERKVAAGVIPQPNT